MRFIIIYIVSILSLYFDLSAQNKRAQIWAMSDHAGWDWSCFPPCVSGSYGMTYTYGTASICTKNGKLLCYTDGANVWNAQHKILENGSNLFACPSGAQNSVFIPISHDTTLIYLVTADRYRDSLKTQTPVALRCYAEDYPDYLKLKLHLISLSGNGKVLNKNIPLFGRTDHISAIKHANKKDTWLFYLNFETDLYTALLLTDCGIVDTVESDLNLSAQKHYVYTESEIRFNNSGSQFAHSALGLGKIVYGAFDVTTGKSNRGIELDIIAQSIMFSPKGEKLYVSSPNNLYEYTVSGDSSSFVNSRINLGFRNIWGMQIVENKVIAVQQEYLLKTGGVITPYSKIFVINFDSNVSLLDSLAVSSPYIGQTHTISRPPNYIQNYLDPDYTEYSKDQVLIRHSRVCVGGSTQLKAERLPAYTPYHWEIYENGKEVKRLNNIDSLSHTFTFSGEHEARLVLDFTCHPDTIIHKLVTVDTIPQPNLGRDTAICKGTSLALKAPQRQVAYSWNNGSTSENNLVGVGEHFVLVTNTCGSTSDTIMVKEASHELTNVITPNGDQLNDHLIVNSSTSTSGSLKIFNRSGIMIFEKDHYTNDWPTSGDKPSVGTYFYEFQFGNCPSIKGWVEIK